MVTEVNFSSLSSPNLIYEISSLINFDKNNGNYSVNLANLNKKNWIYAAIDNNDFFDQDLTNLILAIDKIGLSKVYATMAKNFFRQTESINNSKIWIIDNHEKDWLSIQNPEHPFTHWESILFSLPILEFLIIKPWSVGYNTLIMGKEDFITLACSTEGWLINKTYEIYPV